jgi:hypothetical protein
MAIDKIPGSEMELCWENPLKMVGFYAAIFDYRRTILKILFLP